MNIRAAALAALLLLPPGPAAADPVPLRDFARHAEFTSVRISPAGDYLAVTAPVGDQTGLAILRLADMKVTAAIKLAGGEHILDLWWVGPARVVYTIATKEGFLAAPLATGELLGLDADGGNPRYLFGYRAESGTGSQMRREKRTYGSARMIHALPDDPQHALIAVDSWYDGAEGLTKAYRLDVYTGKTHMVAVAPEAGPTHFVADDAGAIRYAIVRNLRNQLVSYWRADAQADWVLDNVGDRRTADIEPLMFSRDGKAVFLSSDEGGDRACIVRREFGEAPSRQALACDEHGDVRELQLSFDGMEPIAVLHNVGRPQLVPTGSAHPDAALLAKLSRSFGDRLVDPVSASRDGSKIVLLAQSDRDPGDYFLYDRVTGKARYLMSQRSWIDPGRMAERRPVSFAARDGHPLHGYLTLPPGQDPKRLPLVVNPHGGPFGVRDEWRWDADAQALASRGYAVLQVNFRGSEGYGTRHRESARRGWGTTMIDDLTDAVKWATGSELADAARVCIYGGSYGGYAALMSAVREPELYRCTIGYVGVYDLALWKADTDVSEWSGGRHYIARYVGDTREVLEAQSPLRQIDRLRAAVMIVHGEEDRRAPFNQAKALRKALEARGHPYEWLAKDDEGHGFYDVANRTELYEKLIAFLDRHIGAGAKPAAPAGATAAAD